QQSTCTATWTRAVLLRSEERISAPRYYTASARSTPRQIRHERFKCVGELVAGDIVHEVRGDDGIGAGVAFDADVGRVYHLAVDARAAALQADGGYLVHAAACRTAGPVNGEGQDLAAGGAAFQRLGHLDRVALGFDEGQAAVVVAGAGDQATHDG